MLEDLQPFVTPWKSAMMAILPLMPFGTWRWARLRTWAAMFLNSIAALCFAAPAPAGYIAIDLLAGALVVVAPAGLVQRLIGLLFVCMVMFHAGFLLSTWLHGQAPDVSLYILAQRIVGWTQWVLLLGWGAVDVGKSLARRRRADRRPLAVAGRV